MSFSSQMSGDGQQLVISVQGRFDFSTHQDFRSCYESLPAEPKAYRLDMGETTYLDSSALGMLLLLRDRTGGDKKAIEIVNCNPDIKKILMISNFQQLFTIQ